MSKKKHTNHKKQEVAEPEKKTPVALFFMMALLVVVAVFAFFRKGNEPQTAQQQQTPAVAESTPAPPEAPQASHDNSYSSSSSDGHNHSDSQEFRMPPYFENPDLASLAPVKDPSTVAPAAQAAYRVAQKNPKLIAQLPCFCYCDRFGHTSLHDCYVTDHAQDCDICIKEALEADMLDQQGLSSTEIREAIIAKNRPPAGHSH